MSLSHEYQALVFGGDDVEEDDVGTDVVQPISNSDELHSPPKKKRPEPISAPEEEEDEQQQNKSMPSPPSRGFRNKEAASKRRILPLAAPPPMGKLKPSESRAADPAPAADAASDPSGPGKKPLPPLKSKPGFQPGPASGPGQAPSSLAPLQTFPAQRAALPADDDSDATDSEDDEETKEGWHGAMHVDGPGATPNGEDPVAAMMREQTQQHQQQQQHTSHKRGSVTSSVLDGSITSADLHPSRRTSSVTTSQAANTRRTSTLKATKQGVELVAAPGERFKLGTVRRASVEMAAGGKPPQAAAAANSTTVAPLRKAQSHGIHRGTAAGAGVTTDGGPRRTSKYSRSARQLSKQLLASELPNPDGSARTAAGAAAADASVDPSAERRRRSSVWVTDRDSIRKGSQKQDGGDDDDNLIESKPISRSDRLWFSWRVDIQYTLLMLLHGAASTAVFAHFFFKKWSQQTANLPAAAPHYDQKRWVPSVEFGFMHVVLFQFALFPLTMCRYFLTRLRGTVLNRYFPLDALTEFHQYVGIATLALLLALFGLFLVHFGTLCAAHNRGTEPVDFCENFTMEIMITGYVIVGLVLAMLITSLPPVRRRLPFEVFYWTHHLFLALYVVVIIHTLDEKGRDEFHSRSQNVQWVAGPLALYLLDRGIRVWRTKKATIAEAHVMRSPQAVVLKLRFKPGQHLKFKPGQYVQLKVPSVSKLQWHPFAISSSSRVTSSIEVFIQVVPSMPGAKPTWTESVYEKLNASSVTGQPAPEVLVDGPYGCALEGAFTRKHVVMVATGTGIIPMLSLLRDIAAHGKIVVQGQGQLEIRDNMDPMMDGDRIRQKVAAAAAANNNNNNKAKHLPQKQSSGRPPLRPAASSLSTDSASTASTATASESDSKKHAVFPIAASTARRDQYFRDMMNRPFHALAAWMASLQADAVLLAAHRHTGYFVTLVFAAVLDFVLLASEVSWRHNKPKMRRSGPWTLSAVLTLGLIGLHVVAMLAYRLPRLSKAHGDHRTFVSSSTDSSSLSRIGLELFVVAAMIVAVSQTWGDTLPSAAQLGLTALMRLYRMMWSCVHNPLFRVKQAGTVSERAKSAAFVKSIKLLWATSSMETFLALSPILDEVVGVLDVTTHAGYLDVKLNARHLTPTQKYEALEMVQQSSLEGCLEFGTPDFAASLRSICNLHMKDHTRVLEDGGEKLSPPLGIVYCGNTGLAAALRASLISNPRGTMVPVSYISETSFHDTAVAAIRAASKRAKNKSSGGSGLRAAPSSRQRTLVIKKPATSVAPTPAEAK